MSNYKNWELKNKRVLVRADLNVPTSKGVPTDTFKLEAFLPTLTYLLHQKAMITVITHIGRPTQIDPLLSTQQLVPWFKKKDINVTYVKTIAEAYTLPLKKSHLILLENIRFFPQEKMSDYDFANQLAQLGDYFIQDAFGALDRTDTSITVLPTLFTKDKRSIGSLVEQELALLTPFKTESKENTVIILGGGKVKDKIPYIEGLCAHAKTILICPALTCTFLHNQGIAMGKSLVDTTVAQACAAAYTAAQRAGTQLILPVDFQIRENNMLSYTKNTTVPNNAQVISIGPKTISLFTEIIKKHTNVLFNGAIGFVDQPETLNGMNALFAAMATVSGQRVVAGGDSSAAVTALGFSQKALHRSTGGSTALAFVSGKRLPGLTPF